MWASLVTMMVSKPVSRETGSNLPESSIENQRLTRVEHYQQLRFRAIAFRLRPAGHVAR